MSKANDLINMCIESSAIPFDVEAVKAAFVRKLDALGYENIFVDDVEAGISGEIIVTFSDTDSEMSAIFMVDEDDVPLVIISGEEDDEHVIEIDISVMDPSYLIGEFGKFINLLELSWLNASTMYAILTVGDMDFGDDEEVTECFEITEQGFRTVIRGGKRVRLPVVRRKRRQRLTPKQRAGFVKAARKRKAKSSATKRVRKRSLAVRRRAGLRNVKRGTGKRLRVKGQ